MDRVAEVGRGGRFGPRGRAVDPAARAEVVALIGDRQLGRDLLIELLHLLQDHHGALHARHVKALADLMGLAEAEVFEVASFYHHFDLVADGATAPPPVTVRVCDSVACLLAGAEEMLAAARAAFDPAAVRVLRASCLGRCGEAPAALVGARSMAPVDVAGIGEAIAAAPSPPIIDGAARLTQARDEGAYAVLADCLAGRRSADDAITILSDAGLRGLGGAGFPVGRKWAAVRAAPGPRLMTINADEGEPGTFKDRWLLETDPHRMIEGALIAALAVGAERIVLYLRDEYPELRRSLAADLAAVAAAGLDAHAPITLRRGAGAYICGEESAMIESIEGKRGLPRHRPPFVGARGLFGRPTLNHNVETLYWVPTILERGAAWFAAQGKPGHPGLRHYSLSGRVRRPGVKLAPAGTTARELVEVYGGGMAEGHRFAFYLPGGASGGMLPARLADLALDFGALDAQRCFVGSHAVVVFSDRDDPKAIAANLAAFFARESCGQCTPCRVGAEKLVEMLGAPALDQPLFDDLEQAMRDASICGLGQAVPNAVRALLDHFPEGTS